MTKIDFIRQDLKNNKFQNSWDWQADLRFVRCFYPAKENCLLELIDSHAVASIRIAIFKSKFEKIRKERLSILRKLVKSGELKSSWIGTGFMGKSNLGVSRIRHYQIL